MDIRKRIGGSTLAEGIRMSSGGFVNMSDRIRVLTNNRVYRTVCIEKLVDDRTHCCCFDSCYMACDAILMKLIDMSF